MMLVLSLGFAIASQICRSNRKVSKAKQPGLGYFYYTPFPLSGSKWSVPFGSNQLKMQVKAEHEVSTRQGWGSGFWLVLDPLCHASFQQQELTAQCARSNQKT